MKLSLKVVIAMSLVWFLIGISIGYYGFRLEQDDRHELIWAMEFAKESHQRMIDNPDFFEALAEAGFVKTVQDEERWVDTYERVIRALKR